MSSINRFHSEHGSSLIEVIAAIMIVSIISFSFIKYFYQAQSTVQVSDRKLITSTLARQEAERWKLASFDKARLALDGAITGLIPPYTDVDPATFAIKAEDKLDHLNETTYHTLVTLSRVDSFEDLLVKATITVYWDSPTNPRTSSTVVCYITKEDLRR